MKAVVYKEYGSPDVLQLKEVEKPIPKNHEVLIKVHAASINSWDWEMLTGRPFEYRLLSGILKPKKNLNILNELFESGKIKPVIDRSFPLSKTAEAFQYFGEGHFKGKVIITI